MAFNLPAMACVSDLFKLLLPFILVQYVVKLFCMISPENVIVFRNVARVKLSILIPGTG